MSIMRRAPVRCSLPGLLVVALIVLVVGCGGSSETTTSSISPPTTSDGSSTTAALSGDQATIAANWVKFFDGTLPAQDKIGLLENGQQYTKEIESQAVSPLTKMATAAVSSVTITSATMAEVKYSLLVGGTPALPDQVGKAVLQDGVWKVGAESFMALLALQQGSLPTSSTTP